MQTKKILGSLAVSLLLASAAVIPTKAEEMETNTDSVTGMKATVTEIQGSFVKMTTEDGEFITMFVSPGSPEYTKLSKGANVIISEGRIYASGVTSTESSSTYAERLNQKIAAIEEEYKSTETTSSYSVNNTQTTTTTTTTTTTPTNTTPPPVEPTTTEVEPVRALW